MRAPIRLWIKVVLCLVVLDLLLFRVGILWHAAPNFGAGLGGDNWHMLFSAARQIETRRPDPPTAVIAGSSVVIYGADEGLIGSRLRSDRVPPDLLRFVTHGSTATDVALMLWNAESFRPWLVIYGAAARDFPKFAAKDTGVVRTFYDSSVELPGLPRVAVEERLDAVARRYWKLYRYRFFTFAALRSAATKRIGNLTRRALAVEAPRPATIPPEATRYFAPYRITPKSWAAWDAWRQSRRFSDYLAWIGTAGGMAAAVYKTQTLANFGPQDNAHVDSLRWMLDMLRRNRTRTVVLYFPENRVFRDPEAKVYFDPNLSQAYADLLKREAKAHGARFEDLRNLLEPDEFYDLVHANLEGERKLSARIAAIIAEEWRAQEEVDK